MYREKAVSDAIAGVTVGLTVIPQVNLVSIVINIVLAPFSSSSSSHCSFAKLT